MIVCRDILGIHTIQLNDLILQLYKLRFKEKRIAQAYSYGDC